jgi:hypothetical protein
MAENPSDLKAKHWKALALIEEGGRSLKEIAKLVGWNYHTLLELYEGNTQKTGPIGELFLSELNKIHLRNSSKVKFLRKDNMKLAMQKLNEYLRSVQPAKINVALAKDLATLVNALAKAGPSVEIGQYSTHLSLYKSFTDKEIEIEYQRLRNIARDALRQRRVPGTRQGKSGVLPDSVGEGNSESEES